MYLIVFSLLLIGVIVAGNLLQHWEYTPDWIRIRGPLVSFQITRAERLFERIAGSHRLWRRITAIGTVLAFGAMVLMFAVIVLVLAADEIIKDSLQHTIFSSQIVWSVPFLSIVFLSIIVHELGHGILCYVEDIEIESVGFTLLLGLPVAASVEQNKESRDQATVPARLRMYAAGVTNNFLLGLLAFLLLVGPIAGSLAAAPGVHVGSTASGSPADAAGLQHGDVITMIDDNPVDNGTELDAALSSTTNESVQATLADGESVSVAVPSESSNHSATAFGVREHQTTQFLDRLRSGSVLDRLSFLIVAPVVSSMTPDYSHSLLGFSGATTGFYTVSGPLAAFSDVGNSLATVVFWAAWLNLVFGVINCLPALPTDGGHLIRAATETVGTWLGFSDVRGAQIVVVLASTVVTYVGIIAALSTL